MTRKLQRLALACAGLLVALPSFAGPMGFREEPYYEDADPAIQSAPKVDFKPA